MTDQLSELQCRIICGYFKNIIDELRSNPSRPYETYIRIYPDQPDHSIHNQREQQIEDGQPQSLPATPQKPHRRRCQLYRHFDKDGVLLYVGQSLFALKRLIEHRTDSTWYWDIVDVKVETFPSEAKAKAAEKKAIATENPKHNIVGKRRT